MDNYFELINQLAFLDRCHCGPEMARAYKLLTDFYNGSRLINYKCGEEINFWKLPPYWKCNKAILKDSKNNVIADKTRNSLEVFSYSPSFKGKVSREELDHHLLSDSRRPSNIIFHFRNQYRHWNPEWGFSIPHSIRETLSDDEYFVDIESEFDLSENFTQADFLHKGQKEDEYLFFGHFDHGYMVNDGLAGSVVAFEIINRLKERNTRYSYRAFASVEICGSVAYLHKEKNISNNLKEALFLAFSGINSPISYQQSFYKSSITDKAIYNLLTFSNLSTNEKYMFDHRELVGNDENVFDSTGYEIPASTILRYPFKEYHTNEDNMSITNKCRLEEIINLSMKLIDIYENDCYLSANFKGLPCLSNPDINLYMNPSLVSGIFSSQNLENFNIDNQMYRNEIDFIQYNSGNLNKLMQYILRMSDGKHTLLEIANSAKVPFIFSFAYALELEKKNLIKLNN